MTTIAKDLALGCGRAFVVRILATVIAVPLVFVFLGVLLWLMNRGDVPLWTLLAVGALFLLLLFGGSGAVTAAIVLGRNRRLDAIFGPLGLSGRVHLTFFRRYHGRVDNRQVDVFLSRGPRLEIEAEAAVPTRLVVTARHGDTHRMAGWFGQEPLPIADSDLLIFPHDRDWTTALFADPRATTLCRRLTERRTIFTRQQIILRPGRFQLLLTGSRQLLTFRPDPEVLRDCTQDLLELARLAEQTPPPATAEEVSAMERTADRIRNTSSRLILWFVVGLLGFFLVAAVAIAGLVMLLANLGS